MSVREVILADAVSLFACITSDPNVSQYISPPPPSVEAFEGFIAWSQRERDEGHSVCFAIVPQGTSHAVGIIQIRALEPSFQTAEWGFAVGSTFWSTGLFEEAASLVLDFAFTTLGVHRVEGRAVTGNGRGNGALKKLGATGEAVLRRSLNRDGVYYEQFLWSIIAGEWNMRQQGPREPYCTEHVQKQIEVAIQESRRQFPQASRTGSSQPQPHPFFVSGLAQAGDPKKKPH